MRRLVLHIGPPKTATTHCQTGFELNRAELRRNGVLYPRIFSRPKTVAHHGLPAALGVKVTRWDDPPRRTLERSFGLLHGGDPDVVVLSSEWLWPATDKQIARLLSLIEPTEVVVVACLRRWSKLIYSRWVQLAKFRPAPSLLEYVASGAQRPQRFSLAPRLRRWSDRFGVERLALIHLDNLGGTDPFHFLCEEVIGCPAPSLLPPKGVNSSPSFAAIELLRLLQQRRALDAAAISGFELARRYERARQAGHPRIDDAVASFSEVAGLSQLELGWIDDLFRSDGEEVLGSFGGQVVNPFAGQALFPADTAAPRVDYVGSCGGATADCVDALFADLVG